MLAACAAPQQAVQPASCPATQGTPMLVVELFFGRSIQGQAEVGDHAWDDFLDQVVTPNLPTGYTVFDATGAWLNPATSHTIHERTKVLLAALPDAAANAAAVARIRKAYEARFHQTLVGMTVAPACGLF
jgi:Protein of unknown function (DUF3574)